MDTEGMSPRVLQQHTFPSSYKVNSWLDSMISTSFSNILIHVQLQRTRGVLGGAKSSVWRPLKEEPTGKSTGGAVCKKNYRVNVCFSGLGLQDALSIPIIEDYAPLLLRPLR